MTKKKSKINAEVAEKIVEQIKTGRTLTSICRDPGMPSRSTVCDYMSENANFKLRFQVAEKIAQDALTDEIQIIADDTSKDTVTRDCGKGKVEHLPNAAAVARAKLRVNARAKLLAARNPQKWGNKVAAEITGHVELEQIDEKETERIETFLRRINRTAEEVLAYGLPQQEPTRVIEGEVRVVDDTIKQIATPIEIAEPIQPVLRPLAKPSERLAAAEYFARSAPD